MKAKEYLKQLYKLDVIINQKTQEKSELRASLMSISSPDLSQGRVKSSKVVSDAGYSNKVIKIISIEEEIEADMDRFIDLRHTIINQIHNLRDVNSIKLLYKRYIENKLLEVIAVELCYTYDYVRELHIRALQEFEIAHTIPH